MSSYLSASSSSGNRKTWTWSGWTKKSRANGSYNALFTAGNQNFILRFGDATNDRIIIYDFNGSTTEYYYATDAIFRDASGWYHVVLAYDTTQSTSSDRLKVWVNGTLQTALSGSTYPSLNYDGYVNNSLTHYIAHDNAFAGRDFLGVMAHVHFTDGTAYDASAFGETDSLTGIWKPKTAPSVTYGTNGFFLKFENSGSMGADSSGNANNFTVNGTPTQTVDTPSNVFATMSPLINYSVAGVGTTFSNGNNTITSSSDYMYNFSTLGVTKGKYYCEVKLVSASGTPDAYTNGIGVGRLDANNSYTNYPMNSTETQIRVYSANGSTRALSSVSSYGDSYTSNDIIGIALDMDNGKLFFSKNGVWQNSGDPVAGTGFAFNDLDNSYTYGIFLNDDSNTWSGTYQCNFGNGYFGTTAVASGNADDNGHGVFEYAPPTGYLALCTKNINSQEYA